MMTGSILYC